MNQKYEEVRIVFTASPKLASRIIRWLTRSKVSHVFIEYPSALWEGKWAAEATIGGVRKVLAKKARKHVHAEFRCRFDPQPGLVSVSKYIGEGYDYLNAAAFGFTLLWKRWFKTKIKNPLRATPAQFCSELVTLFLKGCRIARVQSWDVEQSAPGRLYRFLLRNPNLFELKRGT